MYNIMSFRNTQEQKKIRKQQRIEKKEAFAQKHGPFMHISEYNAKIAEAKLKQKQLFDKIKSNIPTPETFVSKMLNLPDLIKSLSIHE